jgi:hypothetical protein
MFRFFFVFIFSGIFLFCATSVSEAQSSTGKKTFQFGFRPMATRTWNKDYGFNVGPFESKPAFSFGVQAGAGIQARPGIRFSSAWGIFGMEAMVKLITKSY